MHLTMLIAHPYPHVLDTHKYQDSGVYISLQHRFQYCSSYCPTETFPSHASQVLKNGNVDTLPIFISKDLMFSAPSLYEPKVKILPPTVSAKDSGMFWRERMVRNIREDTRSVKDSTVSRFQNERVFHPEGW